MITKRLAKKVTGVPSADWRTQDIHELWRRTPSQPFNAADGNAHEFLEYCRLLKEIATVFTAEDEANWFDACLFFLRGGYLLFGFLNMTTPLALRATIFGGLNHGRNPKIELPKWLREIRDQAISRKISVVDVLIVDEVKSGGGLGEMLNIIAKEMNSWKQAIQPLRFHFVCYAVMPKAGSGQPPGELASMIRKWQGCRKKGRHVLEVEFRQFTGTLLSYDDEVFCGIRTTSAGSDPREAYEIVKYSGGWVGLACPQTGKNVFRAKICNNILADFMANIAQDIVSKPVALHSLAFADGTAAHGCVTRSGCLR